MNLTLPSLGLVSGENRFKIFKDGQIGAQTTDFAKALGVGGILQSSDGLLTQKEAYSLTNCSKEKCVIGVNKDSQIFHFKPYSRDIGIRFVVPFSDISSYCFNQQINANGHIDKAQAFLFPKDMVPKNLAHELDEKYNPKNLAKPELIYFIDSYPVDTNYPFFPKSQQIYRHKGKLYTRIQINLDPLVNKSIVLSNMNEYTNGQLTWFEVKPIDFIVKQTMNLAITKDIIMGGIPFDTANKYRGKFEKTEMNYYLNNSLKPFLLKSGQYMKKKLR